jgi:hypothetical protein
MAPDEAQDLLKDSTSIVAALLVLEPYGGENYSYIEEQDREPCGKEERGLGIDREDIGDCDSNPMWSCDMR